MKDVDPFGGRGAARRLTPVLFSVQPLGAKLTCHCLSLSHGNSSALEAALADCILDSAISTVS